MAQLNPPSYAQYVDSMRITADSAQPFARELKNAAPADIDAREKKALRVVLDRAGEIDGVLIDRERRSGAKIRPVVTQFVNAWGGMNDALAALARMPTDRAKLAADLQARLFPSGAGWLNDEAPTTWGQANRLLQRIEDEGLARSLDQLLGADVRATATRLTHELGEAIGVGRAPREQLSPTGLQEKMLTFSRAVASYGRQLAANVDESDAASIERFRRAVAPIDAYRSTRTAKNVEPDPSAPAEPAAPTA